MYPTFVLLFACIVGDVLTQNVQRGFCNVCRDGPHDAPLRTLAKPAKTFIMNGDEWTCEYLQKTVADVRVQGGANGEARWCALAKLAADEHCPCNGPPPVKTGQEFKDPNPRCNMCASTTTTPNTFKRVPLMFSKKVVQTGFAGNMNCVGLDDALREGVVNQHYCTKLRQTAGPVCCNPEGAKNTVSSKPNSNNNNKPPPKKDVGKACSRNSDCKTDNCANRKCARKTNGASCSRANQCKSNLCWNRKCTAKKNDGRTCDKSQQCKSKWCFRGKCSRKGTGKVCTKPFECQSNKCVNRKCAGSSSAESTELSVENAAGSDFTDPIIIEKSSGNVQIVAVAALTLGVVSFVLVMLLLLVVFVRK